MKADMQDVLRLAEQQQIPQIPQIPTIDFITLDVQTKKLTLCNQLSLHQRDLYIPSQRTGKRLNPVVYDLLRRQEAEHAIKSGCGCPFEAATAKSGCHMCSLSSSSASKSGTCGL